MSIGEQPKPVKPITRIRERYDFWVAWALIILFTTAGWMRMIDSIRDWSWLNLAGVWPGPLYLVISGALWGLVGLAAAIWLLFRWRWGRAAGMFATLFIATTFWIDRLLFNRAPGSDTNNLFALLFTLLLLGVVIQGLHPQSELRRLFRR